MSLKSRITLIAMAVTLTVTAILSFVGLGIRSQQDERIADAVFTGNRLIWNQLVRDHLERLSKVADDVNQEFDLRRALKTGDQAAIEEYADRFVSLTRELGEYEILQLFDQDGQLVYTSTAAFDAPLSAPLLNAVIHQQKIHSGLAGLSDGRPSGLVAFPLKSRRKLIGLGLLARGLDPVIQRLTEQSNLGVGVVDTQGQISSQMNLPTTDSKALGITQPGETLFTTIPVNNHSYLFTAQPIYDSMGNPIGHLLISRDDSEQLAALDRFNLYAYGAVMLVIAGGILSLFLLLKHYLAPLPRVAGNASEIARGNLRVQIDASGKSEIGQLEAAMQQMILGLRQLVSEIGQVTQQINVASESVEQHARQSHADVDALTQHSDAITQSLHEVSDSIDEVARYTVRAAEASNKIREQALQGFTVVKDNQSAITQLSDEMDQASQSVEGLNDLVGNVSKITEVIQGIAEQTNLLALNAAIEAARAGSQGRGFAVVADEVRTLAIRTQSATQEIETIINQLKQGAADSEQCIGKARAKAHNSQELATHVATRLQEIKESILELESMNQGIAGSVEEQSTVARQITQGMEEIKQLNQTSLLGSRQLSGASHNLTQLAANLQRMTDQFDYAE